MQHKDKILHNHGGESTCVRVHKGILFRVIFEVSLKVCVGTCQGKRREPSTQRTFWGTVKGRGIQVLSECLGEDGVKGRKASWIANWKLAQGPVGTREGMLPQKCANSRVGYTVGQTHQNHPWAQQTRASSWQSLFYYLKRRLVGSELPFKKVFGCSEKKKDCQRGVFGNRKTSRRVYGKDNGLCQGGSNRDAGGES